MRLASIIMALYILAGTCCSVRAGSPWGESSAMRFGANDARLIQRNRLLRDLIATEPRLVRTILDRIHASRNTHPIDGIDPSQNPDLVGSDQTMAAPMEWTDLLGRAQAELRGTTRAEKPTTRSPEGSLEFIDMVKKAKEAKEAAGK